MPICLRYRPLTSQVVPGMSSPQVERPTHEYDLYLTLFITSSGGVPLRDSY
jgi:hypothetical protein